MLTVWRGLLVQKAHIEYSSWNELIAYNSISDVDMWFEINVRHSKGLVLLLFTCPKVVNSPKDVGWIIFCRAHVLWKLELVEDSLLDSKILLELDDLKLVLKCESGYFIMATYCASSYWNFIEVAHCDTTPFNFQLSRCNHTAFGTLAIVSLSLSY